MSAMRNFPSASYRCRPSKIPTDAMCSGVVSDSASRKAASSALRDWTRVTTGAAGNSCLSRCHADRALVDENLERVVVRRVPEDLVRLEYLVE